MLHESCGLTVADLPSSTATRALPFLLFLPLLALVLLTFRDYGISWDEPTRHAGGAAALDFYLGGARDDALLAPVENHEHGVLFDLVAAALAPRLGFGLYEGRHLLNALTGLAGMAAAWVLAARAFGPSGGFLAALLLALTPSWFGHMFMNPKDIPFAAAFAWGLVMIDSFSRRLPRPGLGLTVATGAVFGLALAIRLIGVALLVLLAIVVLIRMVARARAGEGLSGRMLGRLGLHLLLVYLVAHTVMLIGWPWGWERPFHYLFHALGEASGFSWTGPILFAGERIPADQLPRTAILHLLAVKLPLPLLVLAAGGLLYTLREFVVGPTERRVPLALVLLLIVLPPIYIVAARPPQYDEIRHSLFILPAVCAAAAGGYAGLARLVRARAGRVGGVMLHGALALSFAPTVAAMVALHPYAYIYYNAIVGGPRGARDRYETDYWLTAYREAALNLRNHADPDAPLNIFAYGQPPCATYYFPPSWQAVDNPADADFAILTTRHHIHASFPGRPVLTVERMGIPLATVNNLREP